MVKGHTRKMVLRTRPIVRLDTQNRMVTKGYQKGVYDRVTEGIGHRSLKRCKLAPIERSMQTAKQRRRSTHPISQINVSALLSILFVLIVAYFVYRTSGPDLPRNVVDLPKVGHPSPMPGALREDALLITVHRDGDIWFNDERTACKDLPDAIQKQVNQGAPKKIYVSSDGRAKYAYVRGVLDCIRPTGIENVVFMTNEQKPLSTQTRDQ